MADIALPSLPLGLAYEVLSSVQRQWLLQVLDRLTSSVWSEEILRQWLGTRRLVVVRTGVGDIATDAIYGRVGGAYRLLAEVKRREVRWHVQRGPRGWEPIPMVLDVLPVGYWG